jgi:hypothetical protein
MVYSKDLRLESEIPVVIFKSIKCTISALGRVIREIGTHLLSRHGRGKKSASTLARSR